MLTLEDFLLVTFHSFLMTFVVYFFRLSYKNSPLSFIFYPALLFKIFASIAFGLLYFYHYKGGDTFTLYNDAYQFYALFQKSPQAYGAFFWKNEFYQLPALSREDLWELPRALLMVKLISIMLIFTQGSYWLTALYFALINFMGMWYVADRCAYFFPRTHFASALSFLFFPSIVFWSAGLHKESLAMGAWGILVGFFVEVTQSEKIFWKKNTLIIVLLPLTIFVLYALKFYYLGALLPLVIAFIILHKTPLQHLFKTTFQKNIMLIMLWSGLLLLASFSHHNLHPENFLDVLVTNHNATYNFAPPENRIQYWKIGGKGYFSLHSEILYFLPNVPLGMFSGLFRPFVWEGEGFLAKISGLEHLFLTILTGWAMLYYYKHYQEVKQHNLIFLSSLYVIFLATLLAMSTPNFGTLVRYKIGFMPIWLYIITIPISFKISKIQFKKLLLLNSTIFRNRF